MYYYNENILPFPSNLLRVANVINVHVQNTKNQKLRQYLIKQQ